MPYTREWAPSLRAFNERMLAGGLEAELRFPEQACLEAAAENEFVREYFLAVEGPDVRGAYFLTHEHWFSGGQPIRVANFRLPLSEGFVDPMYKGTGRVLLRHALNRSPLLYCLGIGDKTRPLARMLAAENWIVAETAFYFRCIHPQEVLRNIEWLRKTQSRRIVLDAAALIGGGGAIAAFQRLRTQASSEKTTAAIIDDFGDWANELWDRARDAYSMMADRSLEILRLRYPTSDTRFQRLIVHSDAGIRGWAVVLATDMRNHRHFGNLRVGTIVDCLAVPESEHGAICAAANFLENLDVDLIVSNQSHRSWRSAFERAGFFAGPTNRFFTPSPELARLLSPFEEAFPLTHLTRGDGAGPIHL